MHAHLVGKVGAQLLSEVLERSSLGEVGFRDGHGLRVDLNCNMPLCILVPGTWSREAGSEASVVGLALKGRLADKGACMHGEMAPRPRPCPFGFSPCTEYGGEPSLADALLQLVFADAHVLGVRSKLLQVAGGLHLCSLLLLQLLRILLLMLLLSLRLQGLFGSCCKGGSGCSHCCRWALGRKSVQARIPAQHLVEPDKLRLQANMILLRH
jgi:hypothetical protein